MSMTDEQLQVLKEINERQKREEEKKAALIRSNRQGLVGCLFGIFVLGPILVFSCVLYIESFDTPEDKAKRAEGERCGLEEDAYLNSRALVRRMLLAPSSATFPIYGDDETIQVKKVKCGRFTIQSYVDASNAFGVSIRQHYSALVIYNSEHKSWHGTAALDDE